MGLLVFNGFDFLITVDKNLRHQQNPDKFLVTVFLLMVPNNRLETLQKLVVKVTILISENNYKSFNEIS